MCHRNVEVVLARVRTSSASLSFIHFYVSINIKSNKFWLANFTFRLNCWMIQWKVDAFTFYFYVNKLWMIVFPFYLFPPCGKWAHLIHIQSQWTCKKLVSLFQMALVVGVPLKKTLIQRFEYKKVIRNYSNPTSEGK